MKLADMSGGRSDAYETIESTGEDREADVSPTTNALIQTLSKGDRVLH